MLAQRPGREERKIVAGAVKIIRDRPVLGERPRITPHDGLYQPRHCPQIPIGFEEFGFCGEGEAPAYMAEGKNPPYNTSGGGLSEAYVHGFNLLLEGVRQVRGISTSQAKDVEHVLVTGGNVIPTGAVVFSKEPW